MTIVAGIIVPHPPIIIPEIGAARLSEVADTVTAMERLAGDVASMDIDTIVAVSPHSPSLVDAFLIRKKETYTGSFAGFGVPQLRYRLNGDTNLSQAIAAKCAELDVPYVETGRMADDNRLDHGVLVPYHYISRDRNYELVSVSISSLGLEIHFKLGEAIAAACALSDKNILFMASGDLSHRLTPTAPAGYSPSGAVLDAKIVDLIDKSDLNGLLDIDEKLVIEGGECGLRSLVILAGVMNGSSYRTRRLSYEGPFGVGYLVAVAQLERKE